MAFLQFLDHLIPYDTFLNDVAARVVKMLKTDSADPEYVSQRKAYDMFGRANVERWRKLANAPANWSTARQTFAFSNAPHKITSKTETV